ncbi:hypothetical protein NEIPOLOT_01261, partial [Neisseria polysaccharea ATCC 43768]
TNPANPTKSTNVTKSINHADSTKFTNPTLRLPTKNTRIVIPTKVGI